MKYSKTVTNLICIATLILFTCSCGRGAKTIAVVTADTAGADGKPIQYTYKVKAVYPHSATAYTQGLYWHDGFLWEGTGQYGQSALRKVDLYSGEAVAGAPLERHYFGEGIALLGGRIYQATWTDGKVFVYDAQSLDLLKTISYDGEMWGLTTDGEKLYMSDGSHEIHVINPDGFIKERSFPVSVGRRPLHEINELEWIDGRIWANIYMSDSIVIIDPDTGEVEGIVDLQGILPDADRTIYTDVLNGIAYDAAGGRIFVTGKNWNKLFEIEIVKKQ